MPPYESIMRPKRPSYRFKTTISLSIDKKYPLSRLVTKSSPRFNMIDT